MRAKVAALSAVALLGGALGACGDDSVDPQTYVQEVCTSMRDWLESIQQRAEDIPDLATTDPAEGKEAFTGFLEDAVSSTDTLIGELEETGAPDVENGESTHETLIDGFEQARSTLEEAEAQAQDLPTDSPEAFQTAIQDIGTSINNAQAGIQETFAEADSSEELDKAFENEQSCDEVGDLTGG